MATLPVRNARQAAIRAALDAVEALDLGSGVGDEPLRNPQFTYSSGLLTRVDYDDSSAGLAQYLTIGYSGEQATSATLVTGGGTSSMTVTYNPDGTVASVSDSSLQPGSSGSFSYTGDDLTRVDFDSYQGSPVFMTLAYGGDNLVDQIVTRVLGVDLTDDFTYNPDDTLASIAES